ncbi:hypothetical protein HJ588_03120 [Flexivirga sp. ID2601S]|uniref:Solute-binding protein family 5 domain-containing protein n=1 Tax=Flexivirga aerilata TaxID=1656889 RepID=A0A849ABI3_9MICO|nr:ABC transporter substrate-binding protein [Flexivirga aerilata]NNG38264.1 hypothetical protein [Flexivirga aerilata]
MSTRLVHRRTVLVAAAGLAASMTVAACTSSGSTSGGASGSGAGKVGDTLTVAVQAPATGMNPATVDTAFVTYTTLAYEPLIYRDSSGKLQPALASEWKLADGNTTMNITLRSGVKFADGDPVTADAVKKSLEYIKGAKSNQAQYLATVSSITVTDPTHLTIKLSAPNPMLPNMLTQDYGVGEIISPKGLSKIGSLTTGSQSAGAGAYIYDPKASVPGDHYAYTANPNYYAKSERQHYKKIVVKVMTNPQAALNALKTKQVQVAAGDFSTAKQAKAASLDVSWVPFVWAGLNLIDRGGQVSKPLGDVRVRQAINYAIDRKSITSALLGDYGIPTDQPSVKGMDGYSEKAAGRYPFDPAKAKQLLAQAGYPNGFDLPVLSVHFAGIDSLTEALVPQLAKVGIRLKPNYVSDSQSYITGATNKKWPAVAVGYGSQPMYIMGQGLFLPQAKVFNGFATKSPELISLYDKAAAAAPADRGKLNVQMEDWLVENAWFAPVAHTPVFYYSQPTIGGVQVSGASPVATVLDWYDK